MHRFFSPSKYISEKKIIINDRSQVHHIKDVLQLKANEQISIFDEKGKEYIAAIEKLSMHGIILNIKSRRILMDSKKIQITFACAVPKKSKLDDIIDKLTQLGVYRIIPLKTARVVIKLDKQKETARKKRWERIALSASQQSQRNTLPLIDELKDIKEVMAESEEFDLKLLPTLRGKLESLSDIFTTYKPRKVLVIIGPEGDFTPLEVDMAAKAGFIPVSLGELVLRVDTAAIAVASFIRLLFL